MALVPAPLPKREAPWLGIGVSGEWNDYREALYDSQLDFTVHPQECKTEIVLTGMDGDIVYYANVPGIQANVVDDSDKILGAVSNAYGIIQNASAFSLMQPLCDAGAIITHAGMTEQGLVFMVAQWDMFMMNGEDYTLDIMATNSFNGSYPCGLIMTPRRIICQNMYRKICNDQLLHVRHMRLAPRRIEEAKVNQGRILTYMEEFKDIMDHSLYVTLNPRKLNKLMGIMFPYPKDEEAVRYQTSKDQVDRIREEWLDLYYSAGDVKKFGASALRFIHAYYDYLSHGTIALRRMTGDIDRRFSRLVSGDSVNTKLIKEALK